MRFFRAKNDNLFCCHCRSNLLYNEHYLGIFRKPTSHSGASMLLFHLECFPKWNEELMYRRYQEWIGRLDPKPKRGRPRKYATVEEAKKVHREKALAYYHAHKGGQNGHQV